MLTRALKPYTEENFMALVETIRGADIALCNLETSVRDDHEGIPGPGGGGGTPMSTPPLLLDDLKWMGIDAVSYANNHIRRRVEELQGKLLSEGPEKLFRYNENEPLRLVHNTTEDTNVNGAECCGRLYGARIGKSPENTPELSMKLMKRLHIGDRVRTNGLQASQSRDNCA
jgi:Bacterial capsule synthesis protein PGA_cap